MRPCPLQGWAGLPGAAGQDEAMPAAGLGRGAVAECGQGVGRAALAPHWPCCPQPASATPRAPAAASARCREGSVSASPTSSAGAVTTVPRAAMALDPWAAAVSSGISTCQASLSLLSVCPVVRAPFAARLPVHLSVCPSVRACVHLSPAVLQPVGWVPVPPLSICLSIHPSIHVSPMLLPGMGIALPCTHSSVHLPVCLPTCASR